MQLSRLQRFNKTPAELHHAGFIYYNLHDARNHEKQIRKPNLFHVLNEVRRLTVLENSVLRRVLGPNREEVKCFWRKSDNGKLHDLCSSPTIIRAMK